MKSVHFFKEIAVKQPTFLYLGEKKTQPFYLLRLQIKDLNFVIN